MPGEIFETPQTIEPKSTNWPKIILAAVLGFGLLAGAAYAGHWYGTESAKFKTQSEKTSVVPQPTPTLTPPSTTKEEATIYNLTLEPIEEWFTKNICGVNFKVNPKFRDILKEQQPQEVESTCLFGYDYKDLLPGQIIPIIFNVYVYGDYDSSSRRQFYFSKRFPSKTIEDLEAFRYAGSQEFKAGENSGLVLEFEDTDPGDSISGFRTYLVVVDNTKLVAVESSLEAEVLKMFLTGIEP